MALTIGGVRPSSASSSSATVPETMGAAADAPLSVISAWSAAWPLPAAVASNEKWLASTFQAPTAAAVSAPSAATVRLPGATRSGLLRLSSVCTALDGE